MRASARLFAFGGQPGALLASAPSEHFLFLKNRAVDGKDSKDSKIPHGDLPYLPYLPYFLWAVVTDIDTALVVPLAVLKCDAVFCQLTFPAVHHLFENIGMDFKA